MENTSIEKIKYFRINIKYPEMHYISSVTPTQYMYLTWHDTTNRRNGENVFQRSRDWASLDHIWLIYDLTYCRANVGPTSETVGQH